MSLLLPEQIRISLGASYAAIAGVRGSRITSWHMQQFETSAQEPIWGRSVELAKEWLSQMSGRSTRIHVVLSSEIAPLHLLPWREEVPRASQQSILAQNHFQRVFGEAAKTWKVEVAPTAYGSGWIACAVDEALLKSLTQRIGASKAKVRVVEPLLVSHVNRHRTRWQGSECWLMLIEPERLVVVQLRRGQWQLLKTIPSKLLQDESIDQVLSRESRLAGMKDSPTQLFLLAPTGVVSEFRTGGARLDNGWHADGSLDESNMDYVHLLGAPN